MFFQGLLQEGMRMNESLEVWTSICSFPGYSVSIDGRVSNDLSGRVLKSTSVQYGIPTVGLFRDGKYYRRSVPLLVANAWLGVKPFNHFDTPIHLDGNRSNCHVDNLEWRPRWFAVLFHRDARRENLPNWNCDFQLVETGEIFSHPSEVVRKYGVLERDLVQSLNTGEYVFPYEYTFVVLD